MEVDVEHREAVLLRGAGQAVQAAHGEVPGLQVGSCDVKTGTVTVLITCQVPAPA